MGTLNDLLASLTDDLFISTDMFAEEVQYLPNGTDAVTILANVHRAAELGLQGDSSGLISTAYVTLDVKTADVPYPTNYDIFKIKDTADNTKWISYALASQPFDDGCGCKEVALVRTENREITVEGARKVT